MSSLPTNLVTPAQPQAIPQVAQENPFLELEKFSKLIKSPHEFARRPTREDIALVLSTKSHEGLSNVTARHVQAWYEYKASVGEELALSFLDFCCYCNI